MITEIYKIDRDKIDKDKINKASKFIKKGELVAFPTETVYGLGANGLDEKACKKIFEAKKRPADNPLILHISNKNEIYELVEDIPKEAFDVMDKLWPGPMTLIFKKSDIVPKIVTAGGDTVAVRMPVDKIALEFIRQCNYPIAAPSANLSGKPSPTNAKDVLFDMDGRISAIIDGGESDIGIESTVIDFSQKPFTILRPGFYTFEFLKNYIEDLRLDDSLVDDNAIPKSPGQKYKHYAPKAKMEVYVGEMASEKIMERAIFFTNNNKKVGILEFEDKIAKFKKYVNLSFGDRNNLVEMSHNLFSFLRIMDEKNVDVILAEGVDDKNLGKSIMNRMKKSASGNIFKL
ncbi:MAG: L-threonylcarbamoyladenylate synthase [Peptoniphilaceae bacterium]|nr:threonylcarbamoyl-AMP synthase [Peptoniphilaceae bacterium]MDD7383375.1 L-threonylcarbamoyladenylate synthase [Peptoniphilaceae bacterium]MDY3738254.1 L-threonylcarbamoyladenylate synthase [Peptoniphilaceae bacterium]